MNTWYDKVRSFATLCDSDFEKNPAETSKLERIVTTFKDSNDKSKAVA